MLKKTATSFAACLFIALGTGCLPEQPATRSNSGHSYSGEAAGKSDDDQLHAAERTEKRGKAEAMAQLPRWKFSQFNPLPEVPEPSGLCYLPEEKAMFLVDDGDIPTRRPSRLYRLDLDCKVLAKLDLGKDLEGVCWCPYLNRLIVADEQDEKFYLVDPVAWKQTGSFQLQRKIADKTIMHAGGNGIEGVEYIPDPQGSLPGQILALNQDDPTGIAVINVSKVNPGLEKQEVVADRMLELDQINAGEIRYFPQAKELWVIHSWMNIIEVLDPHTLQLRRWEVMPGSAQEGVAFDDHGRMWVAQDTGGIAIYDPLPDTGQVQ